MSKPPSGHWYRVFKNIEISKLCFSCNGWPQFGSEHSFFRDELDIMSTSSGGSTSSFSTATAVESHTIRGYPEAFWQPEVLEQFLPKHYQHITKIEFAMNINFYQTLPNHMWLKSVEALASCSVSDCFRNHHPAPIHDARIRNLAWFGRRQSVDEMGISWLYHATGENMWKLQMSRLQLDYCNNLSRSVQPIHL